ncbi:MAG: 3-deoxy-manno-octulosonate cytidylyltransferase [Phycisphaerales bacterium]|nr:3-deoxy-manno-octulosonate cytidylyltransferase [Phycisphaerales bacterium]
MRPRIAAVIPARYQSVRFPGKMLAAETGKPLIQYAWERVGRCARIHETVIATDDERIATAARAFGARCVMTRADHPNGTSRIAEAVASLHCDLVVNVQGDEPEIEPSLIEAALDALIDDPDAAMATVVSPFAEGEDPSNPNVVKCVLSSHGRGFRAIYFSRSLIPFDRDARGQLAPAQPLKHIGLYVYRREFLASFATLTATALERTEQLEQLRVLEHGHAIAVAIRTASTQGIDTPEQYAAFVARSARY